MINWLSFDGLCPGNEFFAELTMTHDIGLDDGKQSTHPLDSVFCRFVRISDKIVKPEAQILQNTPRQQQLRKRILFTDRDNLLHFA